MNGPYYILHDEKSVDFLRKNCVLAMLSYNKYIYLKIQFS